MVKINEIINVEDSTMCVVMSYFRYRIALQTQ